MTAEELTNLLKQVNELLLPPIQNELSKISEDLGKIKNEIRETMDFKTDINDLKRRINDIENKPAKQKQSIQYWMGLLTSLFGSGIVIIILKYFGIIK